MQPSLMNWIKSNYTIRKLIIFGINILSIFNKVIPKNPNRILFYESAYDEPVDNGEALCHWLCEEGYTKRYKISYCVPSLGLLKSYPINRVGLIGGILLYLRSRYVFFCFGGMRIAPAKNQIVVNLWHGAPLKSIGKITSDQNYNKEKIDDFTYIIATSEYFAPVMARGFGCGVDKVIVCGYPRNDYLMRGRLPLRSFGIRISDTNKRRILWMPTFRKSSDGRFSQDYHSTQTGLPLVETIEELKALDETIDEMNCILVIKAHNLASVTEVECRNIQFVSDSQIFGFGYRLYEFVAQFDALLTDYSSISFDYMILDRPIGYTIDDFDEYQEKRGFSVSDPLSIMPGAKIKQLEDLINFIADISCSKDAEKEIRRSVSSTLNPYRRDHCRRVATLLGIDGK